MSSGVNAFDRVIINSRERPISSDINSAQARLDQTIREVMRGIFLGHNSVAGVAGLSAFSPVNGFLGDGLFVTANGASRNVVVNPGLGFLTGTGVANFGSIAGLDDLCPYFPAYLPSALTIAIDATPSGGNERYDRIEVKQDRRVENATSRDILNVSTGLFEATAVDKTFAYMLDTNQLGRVAPGGGDSSAGISYKVGTEAAIGAAAPPAETTGYTTIAVVYSVNGVAFVRQQDVRDDRKLLFPNGHESFGFTISQTNGSPDVVAVGASPAAHAGLRIAARTLSSPGGNIKVLLFGGGGVTCVPFVQVLPNPATSNFMVARCSIPSSAILTAAEYALIASQVAAFGDTAGVYGQPYTTFEISRAVMSGSDPSQRTYFVGGSVINQ